MPAIKVCGTTNLSDALLALKLKAGYIGFIFYKKSPRYIKPATVKRIVSKIKSKMGNTKTVGVFVNESIEKIKEIVDYCGIDIVQLHGSETPIYCKKIKKVLNNKIIKAFVIRNKLSLNKVKKYNSDFVLFDSYKKKMFGGTGEQFNWNVLKGRSLKRVFLSGGINLNNVKEAVKLSPFAIDMVSGIEKTKGKKDHNKMKLLFKRLKR